MADPSARFGMQLALLRSLATDGPSKETKSQELRSKTMVKMNAKLAIRIAILAVGMVGTFIGASVQPISAADGGPLILCPPRQPNCQTTLPPLS